MLVHCAHLRPNPLGNYLSISIIEQLNYIPACWCKQVNYGQISQSSPHTTVSGLTASLFPGARTEGRSKGRLAMANDQGRRAFLRLAAAAGGAGLLASCSRDSQTRAAGASGTASTAGATAGGAASGPRAAAP